MKHLKNKKLLILGGSKDMINIVNTAKELGCLTYVTDYYTTTQSPAKLVADHYADISLSDIDAVVEYIKKEGIDGVITGFTDSYLAFYQQICQKAGLPCYGEAKAFDIGTDKKIFKAACRSCGVGVIPGIETSAFADAESFAKLNGYPLILKPVDNSGSRGVITCEDESSLKHGFDYAMSYSKIGIVICERFMDCDNIGISYQLVNGEAHLSSICDRCNYHAEGGGIVTGDILFPSKYLDRYVEEMDTNVKQMLKTYGFHDGMVSFQSFVDAQAFYMCEMCYRPSGGHQYLLINNQNGINAMELLIEYAVNGGKIESYDSEKETPFFHDVCAMTHIYGCSGEKVAVIEGIDTIRNNKNVVYVEQDCTLGETIGAAGTSAQLVVSVWFKGENLQELEHTYEQIIKQLKIENDQGKNLIIHRPFFKN